MGQFEEEFTRWESWSNWALFGQFHSPGVRMRRAHMKHLDKQGQMRCVHTQVTNVTNRCPWPVDPGEGRLENESQKPICVCVLASCPPPVSPRPNQTYSSTANRLWWGSVPGSSTIGWRYSIFVQVTSETSQKASSLDSLVRSWRRPLDNVGRGDSSFKIVIHKLCFEFLLLDQSIQEQTH